MIEIDNLIYLDTQFDSFPTRTFTLKVNILVSKEMKTSRLYANCLSGLFLAYIDKYIKRKNTKIHNKLCDVF